ncbi:MAG: hypothetical protein AAB941_00440 [Patescibacteria group bacterium]
MVKTKNIKTNNTGTKNKDSFSRKFLKALAISGAVILASSSPYFGLNAIGALKRQLDKKKWKEFYKELYMLKYRKRVNVSQNSDGSYSVEITNLGKNLVSRYNLEELTVKKPDQWDGFWRFCSFDIPGPKKQARQALLSKLKELGFIMAQKSLWTHPFECREELAVIAKAFEVEPYIHFFVAHDLDKDQLLRKKFTEKTGISLK